jgi:hypothetical protein
MVSSEAVFVRVDCGPPSWFDKLTMRASGEDLTLSRSKGEVRAADLSKVF